MADIAMCTVEATVADGATVTADAFELSAVKEAVTFEDYVFPMKVTDVFYVTPGPNAGKKL